jgi:hypothetical protein
MTMEVQARIYKFLVDCCFEILRLDKIKWMGLNFKPEVGQSTLTQQPQDLFEVRVAERIVLAP